jgi:putative transposase
MARRNSTAEWKESKAKVQERIAELFGNDPEPLRQLVEQMCQQILEAELSRYLGAENYERTDQRTGYRNGYKRRKLTTRIGQLHFRVPQSRDGKFSPELFQRYQRSERALQLTLMEMVLQGVTTRKVETVAEMMCGKGFSASQVSELCASMDETLEAFRRRPLAGSYPYLMVDARYEKVRVDHQVVNQAVLIVHGVNQEGYREVLAVEVGAVESASTWGDLFRDLRDRGLQGVKLVVSDDHCGIKEAVARYFHGSMWQRCRVHFLRNLWGKVARKHRGELTAALQKIWANRTYQAAQHDIRATADTYRDKYPDVALMVEEAIEDTFAIETLPPQHQRKLCSTNGPERVNETLRGRTRLVRIFPNRASCLRLCTALLQEIHEDWITGHRYLTFPERDEIPHTLTTEQVLPHDLVTIPS